MADYDVIVVGAGNAAMAAALSAREAGAEKVFVLEKAPKDMRGGNTHWSGGIFRFAFDQPRDIEPLLPNLAADYLNFFDGVSPYTQADFRADLMRVTRGRSDPELSKLLVSQSHDAVFWAHDHCGVPMEPAITIAGVKVNGVVIWPKGAIVRARRGDAKAAIADNRRGDPVPRRYRQFRVPQDLGIVMGVYIDETRRHDRAVGVDGLLRVIGRIAKRHDRSIGHADIAAIAGAPGAVHNRAAGDFKVVRQTLAPFRYCTFNPYNSETFSYRILAHSWSVMPAVCSASISWLQGQVAWLWGKSLAHISRSIFIWSRSAKALQSSWNVV